MFKNGEKNIIIYSPYLHEKKNSSHLLIVLPSCFCSFSRQALLCHSCYLETWGCKHVSFYLIHCFPPSPFTTVKTCGAKKIIYGCLCPFQSSSGPALPGECRWAHIFGLADLTRGEPQKNFLNPCSQKTPGLLNTCVLLEAKLSFEALFFFAVIACCSWATFHMSADIWPFSEEHVKDSCPN